MPTRTPLRAATFGSTADDIETAFYEALQRGDLDALMACWSDDDEVFCIHPGGPRLVGQGAIRGAFAQMFGDSPLHVRPVQVRKVETLGSAVHNVLERVDVLAADGIATQHLFVLATNIYHRTAEGWRLVGHHASVTSVHAFDTDTEAHPLLH
jgi:ketosteroid isomerase-like protein